MLFDGLVTISVLICMLLLVVVLLQQGKGGGIAAAFGGSSSQTAFGARTGATVLTRATSASPISERWQRQGTASAHMMAVGFCVAISTSRSNASWKAGVCM